MKGLVVMVLLLLAGCADAYRNMYDGLKKREEITNPTAQKLPSQPGVSYDQYDAERKKLLEKDVQK